MTTENNEIEANPTPVRTRGYLESLALQCTVKPEFRGNPVTGYTLVTPRTFTSFPAPNAPVEEPSKYTRYLE